MVSENPTRRLMMAKKLDPADLVSFKELLMANSIQICYRYYSIARFSRTGLSRQWISKGIKSEKR
jgi:hypothetical protein